MVEARLSRSSTEAQSPQFLKVAQSIAAEAHFASRLILCSTVISLGGLLLFWLLCFAGYAVDSFKSATACSFALVAMAAPMAFLYKIHRSLRLLSARLPQQVNQLPQLNLQEFIDSIRIKDDAGPGLMQKAWTRMEVLLHLRTQILNFDDELQQIPLTGAVARFLVNPITVGLAVLSGVAGLLFCVGAFLATLVSLLTFIF